jgi:hypothetical protein
VFIGENRLGVARNKGGAITALADQVEQAVLAEVLPIIEGAVSTLPELRHALERA